MAAIALFLPGITVAHARSPALHVAPDGRSFIDAGGKPFIWLGDTAWMLFQATDREEAELYLETRARQGFTVIQSAFVMGEERVCGTLRPNRYGDVAFRGDAAHPLVTPGSRKDDPAGYDYWDHVDHIIAAAEKRGLVLALLPNFVGHRGDGYKYLNPSTAEAYGTFLGQRYKSKNIVWVMGGDHALESPDHFATWELLARAITMAVAGGEDYDRTMMTYHSPARRASSEWWHKAPWLDFNMVQTWDKHTEIPARIRADYRMTPAKPCGLSEGAYEDGPQYPTGPVNALMVRKQAYWSYFSGGYHSYGNTNVWNFGTYGAEGTESWQAALHSSGAGSMSVLRRFMDSIPWWKLAPSSSIRFRSRGIGSINPMHLALVATDGTGAVIYVSGPDKITLDLGKIEAAGFATAAWVDPRNGAVHPAGEFPTTGEQTFVTPRNWEDALLVLDGGMAASHESSPFWRRAPRPARTESSPAQSSR